jgi:hypothetical protein
MAYISKSQHQRVSGSIVQRGLMIMLLHMPLLSYIPDLLLFILGNINTVVVVVYQVEPDISTAPRLSPQRALKWG